MLEKILQEIEKYKMNCGYAADSYYVGGLEEAEAIIRSHMEDDGWIPVEDRVPKWGEQALTCDAKGNIHIMTELEIPGKPFGIDENHHRFYPVIAWRPLPAPYRPKEEN